MKGFATVASLLVVVGLLVNNNEGLVRQAAAAIVLEYDIYDAATCDPNAKRATPYLPTNRCIKTSSASSIFIDCSTDPPRSPTYNTSSTCDPSGLQSNSTLDSCVGSGGAGIPFGYECVEHPDNTPIDLMTGSGCSDGNLQLKSTLLLNVCTAKLFSSTGSSMTTLDESGVVTYTLFDSVDCTGTIHATLQAKLDTCGPNTATSPPFSTMGSSVLFTASISGTKLLSTGAAVKEGFYFVKFLMILVFSTAIVLY